MQIRSKVSYALHIAKYSQICAKTRHLVILLGLWHYVSLYLLCFVVPSTLCTAAGTVIAIFKQHVYPFFHSNAILFEELNLKYEFIMHCHCTLSNANATAPASPLGM